MKLAGNSGRGTHRAAGEKARPAINRASLRRIERNSGLFAALGAGYGYFNTLLDTGHLGRRDCRQSIILGLFAGSASLRLILQAFVVKEDLLAGSPNKWLAAIDAGD